MDIALLNRRITLQKSETVMDGIGNHKNEWSDYYTCSATVSGESGKETAVAGTTVENTDVSFTVRYCAAVADVTEDRYRVVFGGDIYDIVGIDHLSYKHKCIKLRCKKARR